MQQAILWSLWDEKNSRVLSLKEKQLGNVLEFMKAISSGLVLDVWCRAGEGELHVNPYAGHIHLRFSEPFRF